MGEFLFFGYAYVYKFFVVIKQALPGAEAFIL